MNWKYQAFAALLAIGLSIFIVWNILFKDNQDNLDNLEKVLNHRADVSERPKQGRNLAIIFGIDDYQDNKFVDLGLATSDALAFHDILVANFGYQEKHIFFRTNSDANKNQIDTAFDNWLSAFYPKLNKNDSLIFFFAGHGEVVDTDLSNRNADEPTTYLAFVNSTKNGIRDNGISVREVRNQLQRIPCNQRAIILSCCYSGALFEETGPTIEMVQTNTPTNNKAFWGLTSGMNTPVPDLGIKNHSVLISALLEEMQDCCNSDFPDKRFTFEELAIRVKRRVKRQVWAIGGQSPVSGRLKERDGGISTADFIFVPTVPCLTPREREKLITQRLESADSVVQQLEYFSLFERAYNLYLDGQLDRARRDLSLCSPQHRNWEWHWLNHILHNLMPHSTLPQSSVALSISSKGVIAIGMGHSAIDGKLKIINTKTGNIFSKNTFAPGVTVVQFSPKQDFLVVGDREGHLTVWNSHCELTTRLDSTESAITAIQFTAKGDKLAIGRENGSVDIWDVSSQGEFQLISSMPTVLGSIKEITFSSNGQGIACVSIDGEIAYTSLTNLDSSQSIAEIPNVHSLGFLNSSTVIAVTDKELLQVSCVTGKINSRLRINDCTNAWFNHRSGYIICLEKSAFVFREIHQGNILDRLITQAGPYHAVEFSSPAGKFATINDIGHLLLQDVPLLKAPKNINVMGMNSQGTLALASDSSGLLDIYSPKSLARAKIPFSVSKKQISAFAFSFGKRELISLVTKSGHVSVWDLEEATQINSWSSTLNNISACAWHPNDEILVLANQDGLIEFWDVALGKQCRPKLRTGGSGITDLTVSPNGAFLAAAMKEYMATPSKSIVWDMSSDQRIVEFVPRHRGPSRNSEIVAVSFAEDSQYVVSATRGEGLAVVYLDAPKSIIQLPGERSEVKDVIAFGNRIVSVGDQITIRDTKTGHSVIQIEQKAQSVARNGDNIQIMTDNRGIISFNGSDPLEIASIPIEAYDAVPLSDGTLLIASLQTIDFQWGVAVWNIQRNKLEKTIALSDFAVRSIAISPVSPTMILARDGGELASYNITSGKKIWSTKVGSSSLSSCTFNRSGTKVVVGSEDGQIKIYNISGELVHGPIQISDKPISRILCPQDVDELLVASGTGRLSKWDCENAELTWDINAYKNSINDITFDSDENIVWSVGDNGDVISWSFTTAKQLSKITSYYQDIHSIVITPTEDSMMVGYSWDCNVLFWSTSQPLSFKTYNTGTQGGCRVRLSEDNAKVIAVASDTHGVRLFDTQALISKLKMSID
ncbi:outer membrane biogenesis protein BamB [Gimesia alba]|uniref:Outer membrane biogenesis protein BamB n=1 Tax=Gimesia alba TaxID=2527973 RepID=A0A517RF81_9PLAN|nr:WD40 repeat domain-containing protein [Gimesia alba]QDT42538.1 outer membrane biogenesis protein BamB [Gimesia alba]